MWPSDINYFKIFLSADWGDAENGPRFLARALVAGVGGWADFSEPEQGTSGVSYTSIVSFID